MSNTQALVKRIELAKIAYAKGEPLMTDKEYDELENELRRIDPTNAILFQVGAPITAGETVELPIPLPSLDKLDASSLPRWLRNNEASFYNISNKLDGISALWIPERKKLYTHGSQLQGRDVSAFIPYIQGLNQTHSTFPVRGELIMKTRSKYVPEGKLARNIVAGVFARKADAVDKKMLSEVEFIAYELFSDTPMKPSESFDTLKQLGFIVVSNNNEMKEDITVDKMKEYFDLSELHSQYQLDGIVIVPDVSRDNLKSITVRNGEAVSPKDKMAWKIRSLSKAEETTVISVEWNVSAGGLLKPTVIFEPVVTGGATITRATGIHASWIQTNSIGKGAIIMVERANDTIPKIVSIIQPAPRGADMPDVEYEMIGFEAKEVEVSRESEIARLLKSLEALKVEDVGAGTVNNLYEAGFTSIRLIYEGTQKEFVARVNRVGVKSAEKIYNGLRAGQQYWDELAFMKASNKFPPLVGSTKLQLLLDVYPDPNQWNADEIIKQRLAGISPDVIVKIVNSLRSYFQWREENIEGTLDILMPKQAPMEQPIVQGMAQAAYDPNAPVVVNGKKLTIVLTGFRDKALEDKYNVKETVTKSGGIDYVVWKDTGKGYKETGSITLANKYNIPVIEVSALP